ncbi:MAG TPA: MoaD/ThiS family protein [Nitrospiraceae bacterium]|nr:MoaD/ThiS family protein [Nitrospiraceae bacterium]
MLIRLSGPLLRFMKYQKEHDIDEAKTVQGALRLLTDRYPNLKSVLYDTNGNVRATHRFFLNGTPLASCGMDSQVGSNDCLDILTPIAGG